jgi:hypothetical protein
MNFLVQNSLVQTVENLSESFLIDEKINEKDRISLANFIINQQDKPFCYANTFAPTEYDLNKEFRLFTGEMLNSKVGLCHVIGEEACCVLRKLDVHDPMVELALQKANDGLNSYIQKYKHLYPEGMYCCKTCSCALWLNIGTGGIPNQNSILKPGMQMLKKNRDGKGRWKGFHYYYTLYVLNSLDRSLATEELQYAGFAIEKRLKQMIKTDNKYAERRKIISEQILEKI